MLLDGDVPEQYRVWRREDGSPWRLGTAAYKATDVRSDDLVVLRFFDARIEGPLDTAALVRLGQALSFPFSPNVARLRDLFIRRQTHLAVTEFIEGTSLAGQVEERGAWNSEKVQALARTALTALSALHHAGVTHGNLGPAKLLFEGPDRTLKIVDFGLHSHATTLAPPTGNAATAEDLRRLGVTLWFALTGRMPFAQGLSAPAGTPDWQQLDTLPRSVCLRRLVSLFTRTLNQGESSRRPQNAGALLAALEAQGFQPSHSENLAVREPTRPDEPGAGQDEWAGTERNPVSAATARSRTPLLSTPLSARPETRRGNPKAAGTVALLALAAGLAATWFVQSPLAATGEGPGRKAPPTEGATAAENASATDIVAAVPGEPTPPPLNGGPPVSTAGIQARAERIQRVQPATLEALKLARELHRAATLPVSNGRQFPYTLEVEQTKAALANLNPGAAQAQRTTLVLILGYSDEPETADAATESQDEADALAGALFHDGITAPVYACGLGNPEGMPEIDANSAGSGGFVEVWVASLLF